MIPQLLNIRGKFGTSFGGTLAGHRSAGPRCRLPTDGRGAQLDDGGAVAVLLGGSIGVALGLFASAIGGWVEDSVMRLADLGFAFPALLFAIMLAAVFGPSLTNAVLAIAFINIPIFARVARASANQIWTREYVSGGACGRDEQVCHHPRSYPAQHSRRSSCRPPSNSRSPFSPKRPCPISDLAHNRLLLAGGGCCQRRRH